MCVWTHIVVHLQRGNDSFIRLNESSNDLLVFYKLRRIVGTVDDSFSEGTIPGCTGL
jgi:hypothetical protein